MFREYTDIQLIAETLYRFEQMKIRGVDCDALIREHLRSANDSSGDAARVPRFVGSEMFLDSVVQVSNCVWIQ